MLRRWLDLPLLDESFPLPLDSPFTTAQAVGAGVPRHWLAALHDVGLLRHPLKGVHLAAQAGDDVRMRTACLRLVVPPDAVVCDRHAGWLHRAEMILRPGEHLNLGGISIDLPAGRGRLRNKLSDGGQRELRAEDVTEVDGVRVTTPLRTAWDLGRCRWPETALSGLDAMLRLGRFTSEELVAGVDRFAGMRWVTTLRTYAPLADGRAESPGESALRLRWMEAGLPRPDLQIEVTSRGRLAFLDLGLEAIRFAVEYDGREWHSAPTDREHDRIRRSWLDQDEHWTIRACGSEDVYGRERTIDTILREGIRAARRR